MIFINTPLRMKIFDYLMTDLPNANCYVCDDLNQYDFSLIFIQYFDLCTRNIVDFSTFRNRTLVSKYFRCSFDAFTTESIWFTKIQCLKIPHYRFKYWLDLYFFFMIVFVSFMIWWSLCATSVILVSFFKIKTKSKLWTTSVLSDLVNKIWCACRKIITVYIWNITIMKRKLEMILINRVLIKKLKRIWND